MASYKGADWRMECTIGGRTMRSSFQPGYTIQIHTELEGEVETHTLQADYPALKDAAAQLKVALQVRAPSPLSPQHTTSCDTRAEYHIACAHSRVRGHTNAHPANVFCVLVGKPPSIRRLRLIMRRSIRR